ncbi:MAG: dihydroneopterin aldolase [Euryarchaeota archaeon]|nr:dihydroneopterin aldolase [Euryarchaeota archaeon]
MDKIELKAMKFFAHVGHFDEERRLGQQVEIDLELRLDLSRSGRSDDIHDTLDYRAAYEKVAAVVTGREFRLLEALAESAAAAVKGMGQVETLVRVRKLSTPIGGPVEYSMVEITRPG